MSEFSVCIDWLTVTFHDMSLKSLLNILTLDAVEFIDSRPYQRGYDKAITYNFIHICFEGKGDNHNTINLSMSGQGCRVYESIKKFVDWSYLFKIFLSLDCKVNFTRIDLAIDDKRDTSRDTFTLQTLYRKSLAKEVVSKFKKGRFVHEFDLGNGITLGETLLFGSRSSELMIRFYDKRLERIAKYDNLPDKKLKVASLPSRWLRCELEVKGDKSNLVAHKLAFGDSVGLLAIGILKYYIRFISIDSNITNRSRQPTWRQWSSFVKNVESIRLTIPTRDITLDEKIYHLEKQYARTLAKIAKAESFEFIKAISYRGNKKLDEKDHQDIEFYKYKKLEDRILRQREFENLKIMHDNIKKVPSDHEIKRNYKT